MSPIKAILLGALQGITEFLPVSSSGHLVIAQKLLGFTSPPIFFDIIVHLGTLTAIIVYFHKQLLKINLHQLQLFIIATIPAAIAGFLLTPILDSVFNSLVIVSLGLIFTALILFLSSRKSLSLHTKFEDTSTKQGFMIGIFQALALFPGISRSGSTVAAGKFIGLKKQAAFTFSFLLAIPATLGAVTLQITKIDQLPAKDYFAIALGFLTSIITGFFALTILHKVILKSKLHYFGFYCLIIGFLLLISQI